MTDSSAKPVSRRLRFEILRRDSHTCRYCGGQAPDVKLTVDHVVPVALGGNSDPTNLVTACRDCNAGKSSTKPDEAVVADVEADALRWADAMKRAAATIEAREREAGEYVAAVDSAWRNYRMNAFDGSGRENDLPRPASWANSVRSWRSAGLPQHSAVDAVHVAMDRRQLSNSDVWRYFCGICWRRVEEMKQIADKIVKEID